MMLHGLAGLPRSGTTLLANVLAQNPDFYVSGTSALPLCLEAIVDRLSTSPEVISDLTNVPGSYDRYVNAMREFANGWYADRPEPHIIDKGRGWTMHRALLDQIFPQSVVIVCVRDPRDVVASIERQHRKTAIFNSPLARTLYQSAEALMQPDGMVGGAIRFCEDLVRRQASGIVWVRYESFVVDPAAVMDRIHRAMGCEPFEYNYKNVSNQASDLDTLYYGKFPHDGSGEIAPRGVSWRDVIDDELAYQIALRYPLFMQTFSYA